MTKQAIKSDDNFIPESVKIKLKRQEYILKARTIGLEIYARTGEPITTNDIRREFPIPEDIHPSVMGNILRTGWKKVGFECSSRKEAHGRIIWRYVPE